MSWLLDLVPGGGLTVIAGAALAGLLALWRIIAGAKKAGRDEQLAKEAKARAKNLDDVRRAQDAAAGVRPATPEQLLNDPHNRDNRR